MKLTFRTTALLGATFLTCLAVEPSAVLFENDQVKVARALEKPHVKGKFHQHKPNRVMVYLESGRQRFEYQDGRKPADFDWHVGQVVWSPAEGMHAPEVVSDEPFNIDEIELKNAGTPGKKLKAAPKQFKVEFDNPQVRVLRVKLAAHKSAPAFEHTTSFIIIYLTEQPDHKFGEASWATAGTQKIENNSDKPLEAVIVEVKG